MFDSAGFEVVRYSDGSLAHCEPLMQEIRFRLNLTAAEFLAFYKGAAREVVTKALDGRTVRFPAAVLRPHVLHNGVHGVFALRYDDANKFTELVRIAD